MTLSIQHLAARLPAVALLLVLGSWLGLAAAGAARHWSFRPLQDVGVPVLEGEDAGASPVDAFLLRALSERGLEPNAPLDRRRLIRRVYFDVVGLPPSPEAVRAFVADPDEKAYERLIDRLLADPGYGERWGRHWLDVARYADSDGQEADRDRPTAYHYRDFVIRALNRDMPYDRFVRWQIAGDEIDPGSPLALAATGFLVAGPRTILNVPMEEEKLRNRYNELDDMLATTGQAFLGLNIGCARCHDHKYDPIPTRDYYRMLAVFHSGDRDEVFLASPAERADYRRRLEAWQQERDTVGQEHEAALERIRKRFARRIRTIKIDQLPINSADKRRLKTPAPQDAARVQRLERQYRRALKVTDADFRQHLEPPTLSEWIEHQQALASLRARKPEPPDTVFAMQDFGPDPKPTFVLARGDFRQPGDRVTMGFLSALTGERSAEQYWEMARRERPLPESTYQRKALALWMTDVEQGAGALLARVMVNRLWQHHFGEGLVRTVNDFGTQGEPPSHPELLEWLASDLVRGGWRLKRMHRQILLSAAYQRGIRHHASKAAVDPENRLWWRRRPVRAEAEVLRDAMLAVSGRLNRQRHGPAFYPPIPLEAMQARNLKSPYPRQARDEPATWRRTVYMFHKRVIQYPLMQVFDAPDATASCGRRLNTTVALQGLAMLNDALVRQCAADFSRRLWEEAGRDPAAQVVRSFWLALGRGPEPEEAAAAVAFLAARTEARARRAERTDTAPALGALTDYCQSLLGLNEFIYID